MNKKESLAFLQSCIDAINDATDEDIALFQESYTINCVQSIISSDFEFVPPVEVVDCLYETNEVMTLKILEEECVRVSNNVQWNYSLDGIIANNDQSDDHIPCAA